MDAPTWNPPADWRRITTIDAHAEGEPFRVVTGGFPEPKGDTILQRRRYAREHLDAWRTALVFEPRGHADMYACLVTPPVTPSADLGVLFLHNEGYSSMCGHGIIGLTTVALQTGMLPATRPGTAVRIDTPAGLVTAHARLAEGPATTVKSVYFHNVPSFVLALDQEVEVPALGRVTYDIAFGGAFYAYVRAADVGLECTPAHFRGLIEHGIAIKQAIMAQRPIPHPFEEDLSFLYGVVFVGPAESPDAHSRNVCVFADGEIDRCPTGTSVSARLAIHLARGELDLEQTIHIESILGTRFSGRAVRRTRFGPHDAIVPEIEGSAYITGRHEFLIDPADPLRDGFILR